jgi:carbon starvation protein
MNLAAIVVVAVIILGLAYRLYGRWVARMLGVDDNRPTPAHTQRDNIDYMPAKTPVLFGHHFASIAGAGPIVGPVIAVSFGWIPALLWIIFGAIFFGAVHDLGSIVASLRHQGKSIGAVIERYIGRGGKALFLIFAFATMILVIAVFMDIVARTFVSVPSAATSSMLFMALAVAFGLVANRTRLPLWLVSLAGVLILYLMVYAGTLWPLRWSYGTWVAVLSGYCFLAAIAPVWVLLQPRDYLNSFLLYGMMLFGIAGIFAANPSIRMDSAIDWNVERLGLLFPVLFVTVACGAISGFHSMVASGTTSKQINRESDAVRVGYGGMLLESLLAVIAVGTVVVLTRAEYTVALAEAGPVTLFSRGLGGFMTVLGIPAEISVSFVALTVSAFAVTTLDTCTRLARFAAQEFFQTEGVATSPAVRLLANNRYASTTLVVLLSLGLLLSGQFQELWPVFGSANQLLAALALLAVTAWLRKIGVNALFTAVPMVFMFTVTLSSLGLLAWRHATDGSAVLAVVAILLLLLALALIRLAARALCGPARGFP